MKSSESKQKLIEEGDGGQEMAASTPMTATSTAMVSAEVQSITRPLGPVEKAFLLHAERGDCESVKKLIKDYKDNPEEFDINCVDPLNRSALTSAIENENIELVQILLDEGIKVGDALLHAIKEEYIEAVELLLNWEEDHHKPGDLYSWESVDRASSSFTPDITPLILAAHKNNYEIIKLLLDRGATLPMPHDVRCGCDDCVQSSTQDSLRHSQSRINAYRALTSSSLIAVSSKDPLLTAFELSKELKRLSWMESEFRFEYNEMRGQVQTFAMSLLDHARTSEELEIILNYDPDGNTWEPGDHQTLERLKLAINYKQKSFVAHPNVQQLMAAIWYEGLPGFRRRTLVGQSMQVAKIGAMFPVYCGLYMMAPDSKLGAFMKKPFVKFICHSSSYAFFLMLLGAASQRIEVLAIEWFGTDWMQELVKEWKRKERGAGPGLAECGVILYMISLIWAEIRALWADGLVEYISDLWNIVDFITNMFYIMWLCLRMTSFYIVWKEANLGNDPWYPREQWHSFDPMLLSEGAFAAGMIFSFLKLVHIFSVNPHLGPLQISLGRMIIDIVKFFFIYTLVLFAFGCGLNQLLWYYAELEKNKCYRDDSGIPDFDNNDKACTIWRRYANLFETSQSLFWASFGLVDLVSFELTGIKGFTRFWALLMFGSYSVINVIVLLNMLIAMMSNSYQIISERSDMEWKFARSRLWMSYFDDGDTLPPPFNIFPTMKMMRNMLGMKEERHTTSIKKKNREHAKQRHDKVMRLLVTRYVTAEQTKRDDYGITEDDVMEIRQDISKLRYELIHILHNNGMKTPQIDKEDQQLSNKKGKVMERRIMKDFHIGIVEGLMNDIISTTKEHKDVFSQIAKVIGGRSASSRKNKDWNALVRQNTVKGNPIGTAQEIEQMRIKRQSLRKHILTNIETPAEVDQEKLIEYNPRLTEVPRQARLAYAKFMTKKMRTEYGKEETSMDEEEKQREIDKEKEKNKSVVKFSIKKERTSSKRSSKKDSKKESSSKTDEKNEKTPTKIDEETASKVDEEKTSKTDDENAPNVDENADKINESNKVPEAPKEAVDEDKKSEEVAKNIDEAVQSVEDVQKTQEEGEKQEVEVKIEVKSESQEDQPSTEGEESKDDDKNTEEAAKTEDKDKEGEEEPKKAEEKPTHVEITKPSGKPTGRSKVSGFVKSGWL